ncbi:hypothetical protein HN789_05485 [archaeon]|jgi:hypothetical protein|nr:hypothetical protein [archaeon]MBT4022965.1 hypothetical protein [archaeon]MBT4271956.1 hypothetical protein [archaeon]MBT4461794.1 hypothetical protein [archaeon]MBT4858191.1 hypothetical protein [archaeon]
MKSKLIFRADINWGYLGKTLFIVLIILNFLFVSLVFFTTPFFILFGIPIFVLDLLLMPLIKSILKIQEFELHTDSLKIKNKKIDWKKVKSISFQTGRLIYDRVFYKGFKLPTLQKIFVLDKEGYEYSAIIDIDYYFKKKRQENNIRIINRHLLAMDKQYLVADWAEKR